MGRRDADNGEPAGDGGLDDLFGDEQFREYDDGVNPFVAPPTAAPTAAAPPAEPVALPWEERGPIHDRLSPTVAMPTVTEEDARAPDSAAAPGLPPGTISGSAAGALPAVALHTPAVEHSQALPAAAAPRGTGPLALWARFGTPQRVLVGVAGGAVLALLLGGLFVLGAQLGGSTDAADTASGDETGVAASVTSLEPGVHPWSALLGGECLDPFDSVWAEDFTVVDCGEGHAAQFMYRGEAGEEVTVYLDAEGWQGLVTTLCDAGALLDFAEAAEYTDLQWHISYAGDATEWANGDRGYSCFIDRASGEPIAGSLLAAP